MSIIAVIHRVSEDGDAELARIPADMGEFGVLLFALDPALANEYLGGIEAMKGGHLSAFTLKDTEEMSVTVIKDPQAIEWAEVGGLEKAMPKAKVEEVAICGCTNEDLETGLTCGQDECPNKLEVGDA